MKKVSIIVPIYKVEDYINCCIDSLLAQSYKNIEIILVNDGSPDLCPSICEEYARKNQKIRYITKTNGGLSSARNAGIEVATGSYITFVDSDDWIHPEFVELLVDAIERTGSDISICGYCTAKSETDIRTNDYNMYLKELSNYDFIDAALYGEGFSVSAWGKLYKSRFFDNLRYCEGILYEDLELFPDIAKSVDKAVFISKPLYYYRIRPESIINSKFSIRKYDYVKMALKCKRELRDIFKGDALDTKITKAYIDLAIDIGVTKDLAERKLLKECIKNARKNQIKNLFNKRIEKKYRIFIVFNMFGIYQVFNKIYTKYIGR